MIKLYEAYKITRTGRYRTIVYTEDMQTFRAERWRNELLQRAYFVKLREKVTKEEIMEAQNIITNLHAKYQPWKLMRMLVVIAVIHAKMSHNTRKTFNIMKCIESSSGITPKMVSHTIKDLGL